MKTKLTCHECDRQVDTLVYGTGLCVECGADQIKTMVCEDCENVCEANDGRPYKYEPSIWLCDDCESHRMEEE
jgi:hypothetical protein